MSLFVSKLMRTDITFVKILKNCILTGIGGDLNIFCIKSRKLLNKVNIFYGQKIYGIIVNHCETKVIIYGGRLIKILQFSSNFELFDEVSCVLNEWILDAKWLKNESIGIVTMQNKFILLNSSLKVEKEIICDERCILYSAFICYNNSNDIAILSGTVFSEVLLWVPSKYQNNGTCPVEKKLLGHKGVIFSIDYNSENGCICSCSDDRSAILWKVKSNDIFRPIIEVDILCQVYGHSSRIFRCKILNNFFITAGEDSFVILWSNEGNLLRKIEAHQGSSIWAFDCDENNNTIAIGGGNSGLSLLSINVNVENKILKLPDEDIPKSICILNDNCLACVSENATLYYYSHKTGKWTLINTHAELRRYCLLQLSECRQFLALAGFSGDIVIYKSSSDTIIKFSEYTTQTKSRIFSFHWLSCKSFLICQEDGLLRLFYIHDSNILPISLHELPSSKERWSTSACFINTNLFVVGDRKGHIYTYSMNKREPVQVIRRVHNHLGVTDLYKQNKKLISLGRNGIFKTFTINRESIELALSEKVPFSWLAKVIGDLLFAFSGNNFVIWNYKTRCTVFEKDCGGGHRSWGLSKLLNVFNFVYVKDKLINWEVIDYNSVCPMEFIEGLHVNEINCLKMIKYNNTNYFISGGEDTTLQINALEADKYVGLRKVNNFKAHLSSIRAIEVTLWRDRRLIFSAGGRGQIICWMLSSENEGSISCSQVCSYYESLQSDDSEMRIMDLFLYEETGQLYIFAACSNGYIKLFYMDKNNNIVFKHSIFYKLKCITKITGFNVNGNCSILVTMATNGFLVFWDMKEILNNCKNSIYPIKEINAHQSGINSYAHKIYSKDQVLYLTGGDDNAVTLNLLKFTQDNTKIIIDIVDTFKDVGVHCAQITGAKILGNHFFTVSIDQRLCFFEWTLKENSLSCKFVGKYCSAVADIQGFAFFDDKILIYGNGIECVEISSLNKLSL